jgi:hypothetical protein
VAGDGCDSALSTASGSAGRVSLGALLDDHVVVRHIERGPSEVRFLAHAGDPTVVTTHPHASLAYARRDLSWGLSTLRMAHRRR